MSWGVLFWGKLRFGWLIWGAPFFLGTQRKSIRRIFLGQKRNRHKLFIVLDFLALCLASAMRVLKRTLTTLLLVVCFPLILVVSFAAAGWGKDAVKLLHQVSELRWIIFPNDGVSEVITAMFSGGRGA